ncbi:MAG TPA: EamA family transporter, partial [Ramlibacter sp.]
MQRWVAYAFVSMFFAGFTSVIAKKGLAGISADLGLAVRTCFVFVYVLLFAAYAVPASELDALTRRNVLWLALSGVTTALSWVFYYKAI